MKLKVIGKGYPWTPPAEMYPDATMTGPPGQPGSTRRPELRPRQRRLSLCRRLLSRLLTTSSSPSSATRTSSRQATPRGDPRGVPKFIVCSLLRIISDSSGRLEGFGAEEDIQRLYRAFSQLTMEDFEDILNDNIYTLLGGDGEPSEAIDYTGQLAEFLSSAELLPSSEHAAASASCPTELYDSESGPSYTGVGEEPVTLYPPAVSLPAAEHSISHSSEEGAWQLEPMLANLEEEEEIPGPAAITLAGEITSDPCWSVLFDLTPSCDNPLVLTAVAAGGPRCHQLSLTAVASGHPLPLPVAAAGDSTCQLPILAVAAGDPSCQQLSPTTGTFISQLPLLSETAGDTSCQQLSPIAVASGYPLPLPVVAAGSYQQLLPAVTAGNHNCDLLLPSPPDLSIQPGPSTPQTAIKHPIIDSKEESEPPVKRSKTLVEEGRRPATAAVVVDYSKLREDNNKACREYRRRRKEHEHRLALELDQEQERNIRLKARLATLQGIKDKMQQLIITRLLITPSSSLPSSSSSSSPTSSCSVFSSSPSPSSFSFSPPPPH